MCPSFPFLLSHAKRERKLENRLLTLPYFQNHTTSDKGESWSRSAFIIIGWHLLERFFQGLWQHSVRMPNTFTEKETPIFGTRISFFRNVLKHLYFYLYQILIMYYYFRGLLLRALFESGYYSRACTIRRLSQFKLENGQIHVKIA